MYARGDMNKLYPIPIPLTVSHASLPGLEPKRRLIVLAPDMGSDYIPALRRIWELAHAQHAQILFLGLCKDAARELSLHRQLVAMSAMIRDDKISAEARIEIGTNWVDIVKRNSQTGDMIVCFEEQRAGLLHRPLSQILESKLSFPVYILSGLYPQKSKSNWLSQVIAWSGFIGIIICFGILQVKIVQLPKDWFQNALLIFSVILEFWLIRVWDNLFG